MNHNWLWPQPPLQTTRPNHVELVQRRLVVEYQPVSTDHPQDQLRPVQISPTLSPNWFFYTTRLWACSGPWSSCWPPAKIMPFWSWSQANGLGHQSRAQGVFGDTLLCFGFVWQPSFLYTCLLPSTFNILYLCMCIEYSIVPSLNFPLKSKILHLLWLIKFYGHQKC